MDSKGRSMYNRTTSQTSLSARCKPFPKPVLRQGRAMKPFQTGCTHPQFWELVALPKACLLAGCGGGTLVQDKAGVWDRSQQLQLVPPPFFRPWHPVTTSEGWSHLLQPCLGKQPRPRAQRPNSGFWNPRKHAPEL